MSVQKKQFQFRSVLFLCAVVSSWVVSQDATAAFFRSSSEKAATQERAAQERAKEQQEGAREKAATLQEKAASIQAKAAKSLKAAKAKAQEKVASLKAKTQESKAAKSMKSVGSKISSVLPDGVKRAGSKVSQGIKKVGYSASAAADSVSDHVKLKMAKRTEQKAQAVNAEQVKLTRVGDWPSKKALNTAQEKVATLQKPASQSFSTRVMNKQVAAQEKWAAKNLPNTLPASDLAEGSRNGWETAPTKKVSGPREIPSEISPKASAASSASSPASGNVLDRSAVQQVAGPREMPSNLDQKASTTYTGGSRGKALPEVPTTSSGTGSMASGESDETLVPGASNVGAAPSTRKLSGPRQMPSNMDSSAVSADSAANSEGQDVDGPPPRTRQNAMKRKNGLLKDRFMVQEPGSSDQLVSPTH